MTDTVGDVGVKDEAERVAPGSVDEWRAWLEEHHEQPVGVWVAVTRRADSALPYEEAVCEALCVGWIDGQARSVDGVAELWFSPRRPGSGWARTNKERLVRLEAEGRMRPAGQAMVDRARADGSWTLLDGPEAGVEPDELRTALDADPAARAYWDALPPSARKLALTGIATAKRDDTRARRVAAVVEACAAGRRPG